MVGSIVAGSGAAGKAIQRFRLREPSGTMTGDGPRKDVPAAVLCAHHGLYNTDLRSTKARLIARPRTAQSQINLAWAPIDPDRLIAGYGAGSLVDVVTRDIGRRLIYQPSAVERLILRIKISYGRAMVLVLMRCRIRAGSGNKCQDD